VLNKIFVSLVLIHGGFANHSVHFLLYFINALFGTLAFRRTEMANQRGGSKWEPIKIILEGDRDSNKMNTASNTRLSLTTQVGQDHATTGVLLALGTNNQLHRPENAAEHKP
jgi:hypothetical protein